jgi:hypothetical protein
MRSLVHSLKKVLCLLNSRLLSTWYVHCSHPWTRCHTDGALKDVVDTGVGASPRQLMQYIGTDLCNSDYKKISIDRSKYILCTCSRQNKKHRLFYHNRFTIPARIHRVGYCSLPNVKQSCTSWESKEHLLLVQTTYIPLKMITCRYQLICDTHNASLESLKERAKYVHRCVIPFI